MISFLFADTGVAEMGARATAGMSICAMLVIAGLAYFFKREPSEGLFGVITLVALACVFFFKPWQCFLSSPNPENDPDITSIDRIYFNLGLCWVGLAAFVSYCFITMNLSSLDPN